MPNPQDTKTEDVVTTNPTDTVQAGTDNQEEMVPKSKFTASAQEAIRLKHEVDRLTAEKAALEARQAQQPLPTNTPDSINEIYPEFGQLDPEEQNRLANFVGVIKKQTRDEIYQDPAISFARLSYNEKRWDDAFASISLQYPDLAQNAADFRSKYFDPNNVPDNIADVLRDIAKIYLFDRAKEIGAAEERERGERIDIETATGGDRNTATQHRTLAEWQHLAATNPQKFASLGAQYDEDLRAMNQG